MSNVHQQSQSSLQEETNSSVINIVLTGCRYDWNLPGALQAGTSCVCTGFIFEIEYIPIEIQSLKATDLCSYWIPEHLQVERHLWHQARLFVLRSWILAGISSTVLSFPRPLDGLCIQMLGGYTHLDRSASAPWLYCL